MVNEPLTLKKLTTRVWATFVRHLQGFLNIRMLVNVLKIRRLMKVWQVVNMHPLLPLHFVRIASYTEKIRMLHSYLSS